MRSAHNTTDPSHFQRWESFSVVGVDFGAECRFQRSKISALAVVFSGGCRFQRWLSFSVLSVVFSGGSQMVAKVRNQAMHTKKHLGAAVTVPPAVRHSPDPLGHSPQVSKRSSPAK